MIFCIWEVVEPQGINITRILASVEKNMRNINGITSAGNCRNLPQTAGICRDLPGPIESDRDNLLNIKTCYIERVKTTHASRRESWILGKIQSFDIIKGLQL